MRFELVKSISINNKFFTGDIVCVTIYSQYLGRTINPTGRITEIDDKGFVLDDSEQYKSSKRYIQLSEILKMEKVDISSSESGL